MGVRVLVLSLLAAWAAWAQPSAAVALTEPLAAWRAEIEALGGRRVVVARVFTDTSRGSVHLPRDAGERPILVEYLRNSNFLKSMLAAHAVTIHHRQGPETIHFILLNMARQAEWSGREEAVIGLEMGRAWLHARDYPMPAWEAKDDSCLAMQAGDLIQRQVIRAELARRGIDFDGYWLPLLELAAAEMEAAEVRPWQAIPTCPLMSKLVLWLDVRLGVPPGNWKSRERFLAALRRSYPILGASADDLHRQLAGKNFADRRQYESAVQLTLNTFYAFVDLVLKRRRIQVELETVKPQ